MAAPTLPSSQQFALRRYHARSQRWASCDTRKMTPREWWLCLYERYRDSTEGDFRALRIENALRSMLALHGRRHVDPLMVSLRRGSIGMIGPHRNYPGTRPVDARRRTLALARDERVRCAHYGARLP